jgi:hypothetical protein
MVSSFFRLLLTVATVVGLSAVPYGAVSSPVDVIEPLYAKVSKADGATAVDLRALFDRGQNFKTFLARVSSQRTLWIANATRTRAPDVLVRRLMHARQGLQLLIVAEDWCPDSVNTVPFVAALADQAHVPLRIIDRTVGRVVMDHHRSADGRTVTPVIVLLRKGVDVGAWVERPAPLQKLFRSMGTNPSDAVAFAARQHWYDADKGQTALAEIVNLVEGSQRR